MLSLLRRSFRRPAHRVPHIYRSLATGADLTRESHIKSSPIRAAGLRVVESTKLNPAPRKDVYQLPTNNEEIARLNNQHVLLKMLIGGNYTNSVKEHLRVGQDKAIFDLGCGTGAWARDIASDFPHCKVIGADVAPMDTGHYPKNLRIETCDANKGLVSYRNEQFDFANARMIAMGITDYPSLIGEFARILKPGGFLQLQEWDFFAVDQEKRHVAPESWFGRWCAALRTGLALRGAGVDAANGLDEMVRAEGFISLQEEDVWMPVGPFSPQDTAEGIRLNLVGEFMRENVKAFIKGGRTLITKGGMNPDEYDNLAHEATKEVQDASFPIYLRLHCVTARKP